MALPGDFEGVGRECDDIVAAVDSERTFECLFEGRHHDVSFLRSGVKTKMEFYGWRATGVALG